MTAAALKRLHFNFSTGESIMVNECLLCVTNSTMVSDGGSATSHVGGAVGLPSKAVRIQYESGSAVIKPTLN